MKKYLINLQSNVRWLTGLLSLCLAFSLGSCTEEIDESNFAIATEKTVSEYVASVDSFSCMKLVLDQVKLGNNADASSLFSVLSTRGNYTVFLAGDHAFAQYLYDEELIGPSAAERDSLTNKEAYVQECLTTMSPSERVALLNADRLEIIAKSCVIDNGDLSPYESADFPTKGSFNKSNLLNRMLDCNTDDNGEFVIAKVATVTKSDIELSNGMVHLIDAIISPSNKTLPDLIGMADNLRIMSFLLKETTWADSLTLTLDMSYEETERAEYYNAGGSLAYRNFLYPDRREYGYTAFVETDDVFEREWGISLPEVGQEVDWASIKEQILHKCKLVYPESSQNEDFTHPDNAVNQFVAYHLLKGRMAYNRLVRHFNEYGYQYGSDAANPSTSNYPTNVWDYYTTMGNHPSLVKVVQLGNTGTDPEAMANLDYEDKAIFLNRVSVYANGRKDDYHEIRAKVRGLKVSSTNGEFDNNAINGYYFPVDGMLINDAANKENLGGERIRFDLTTVLHEYLTNNIRGGDFHICPKGYFENVMNESSDTKICYLNSGVQGGASWRDYQGDEVMVLGLYDFTMKLPPVPKSGTYEIRMGQSFNNQRGMCQIYFGESPYQLQPAGLPLDMRQSASKNPSIPWVEDSEEDDELNIENDKNLRNQGYMKAPQYATICNGTGTDPLRTAGGDQAALRYIIGKYDLEAGKTYYIRFKSALKKLDSQCFMDYFEYVPTMIIDNDTEDIW